MQPVEEEGPARLAAAPLHLLVVEDDPSLARLLLAGLRGEGYDTQQVVSAAAAESLVANEAFDLVLLDRRLPDRSGESVLRAWRSAGRTMPVVLLTEREGADDLHPSLASGTTAFVPKPFKLETLLKLVAALLPR